MNGNGYLKLVAAIAICGLMVAIAITLSCSRSWELIDKALP